MPPPTLTDSWFNSRRFGIVIDAGSSGSRLQIYSWKDAKVAREEGGKSVLSSLPKVEKGTRKPEDWVAKMEPGLSSFAETPNEVASHLAPLLEHARSHIPVAYQYDTPLFLLATAGMRLLSVDQQMDLLKATCDFLKFHSNFRIDEPSSAGPCGSSVRIITGEEEGLFGWLAVNYLMDGFTQHSEDRTTYGFLDMGGASTQIAFEPSPAERKNSQNNLVDVRLRLLGGDEIQHKVFVTTWLGYGTNQARERYVAHAIDMYEDGKQISSASADDEEIPDPCLPINLKLKEKPFHTGASTSHSRLEHTLIGAGSFERCLKNTLPLLNKDVPCHDTPCLFNGVHVPPIDFSVSHFIGVSEYWYSAEHVFGLGGAYDFVQYERAASDFCQRDWRDVLQDHERSTTKEVEVPSGTTELAGGHAVTSRRSDRVEISRLQMQCFKAAWVVNVLHNGLGMPRIVDQDGNSTSDAAAVTEQARNKGFGRPTFQSVDKVGDITISWTLGKMVLEASKEVPPLSATTKPITDPLDGFSHWIDSPFHFTPLSWELQALEDRISDHLPPSLTRESLGFSLVSFVFYSMVAVIFMMTSCRLRHALRATLRRISRNTVWCRRGGRSYAAEGYAMEEGLTSPRLLASSRKIWWSIRGMTSSFKSSRPTILNTSISRTNSKISSPSRSSPVRSFTFPMPTSSSTNLTTSASNSLISSGTTTSTGTQHSPRLGQLEEVGLGPFFSARSRNSSQMNLSSLVPRQPVSRTNSALYLPLDGDE